MIYDLAMVETERLWWKSQPLLAEKHKRRFMSWDSVVDELLLMDYQIYLAEVQLTILRCKRKSYNKLILNVMGIPQ
jgi:hypothetical protein